MGQKKIPIARPIHTLIDWLIDWLTYIYSGIAEKEWVDKYKITNYKQTSTNTCKARRMCKELTKQAPFTHDCTLSYRPTHTNTCIHSCCLKHLHICGHTLATKHTYRLKQLHRLPPQTIELVINGKYCRHWQYWGTKKEGGGGGGGYVIWGKHGKLFVNCSNFETMCPSQCSYMCVRLARKWRMVNVWMQAKCRNLPNN